MIPKNLEETIAQAKEATKTSMKEGCTRIQIELVIPEIELKAQYLAYEFTSLFADYGSGLKVIFPDTGAAALARRDWKEIAFQITDLGSSRSPLETKIDDTDEIFLIVSPSAVEVLQVEKLCNLVGDRPVILLIPQLEDISIVGIGYAARQLRERFLTTLESSYYIRPLEGAVVLRSYPGLWQVWEEKENDEYQLISEQPQKPLGEVLDRILMKGDENLESEAENEQNKINTPKLGLVSGIKSFLKALSN